MERRGSKIKRNLWRGAKCYTVRPGKEKKSERLCERKFGEIFRSREKEDRKKTGSFKRNHRLGEIERIWKKCVREPSGRSGRDEA